jgi:ABC-2 type transport system permease protein
MKALDLAFKDLLRAFRSVSFLAFGLIVPLLVSGLFYFAFRGLAMGDGGWTLPPTTVQLVNLDAPSQEAGDLRGGALLAEVLRSESLAELLQVTEAPDPDTARAAVDRQRADVAVIIPVGFTQALLQPEGQARVEVYHDPTLTLGPGLVTGIVQQFVDGFAGAKIAADVARSQLAEHGVSLDAAQAGALAQQFAAWAMRLADSEQAGQRPLVAVRPARAGDAEADDVGLSVVSLIMSGMMAFFVFFTGASTALSLLQEEEGGTLARLFTTPTALSAILGGRIIASLATLLLQVVVLLVASALVFGIDWGAPPFIALVTLGTILLAGSFGLFVISLLRDTRQGGIVIGGAMTVAGMVGMMSTFTAGTPTATQRPFEVASLLVPHGWVVQGWRQLLEGGGLGELWVSLAVMLALSVVFFALALFRFRRRFA